MFSRKFSGIVALSLVLSGLTVSAKATYYQDTLFPIGLTGINPSGDACPYSSQGWTWDEDPRREDSLIFNLGINCIGCQDAKR